MKKIVQDHFLRGKWGKMLSLARLALVALVCSVGTMAASAAVSSATQQQNQSTRRTVTGVVTDENGRPVVGAHVSVRGTTSGTTTDAHGRYSLSVARGATLEFSFVGMTTRTVTVNNQTAINAKLESESVRAQQVVISGTRRAKESFTGAARLITSEELQNASAGSVITAIRNVDPSFYIVEDNIRGSNPNAVPVVQMRGQTTIPVMSGVTSSGVEITNVDQAREYQNQANLPLLLIDGFTANFSELMDIDESLIESITLLKDASATALYGTRGSNGVIDVTLKKPKTGTLRLHYTGGLSFEVPDLSSYNLMNAEEKLRYEVMAGRYNDGTWERHLYLQRLYTAKKIDVERGVNTDWLHYPLRVAASHNHSLRLDGGEKTFQYSANVYYNNTNGVMKQSGRNNFRGGMKFVYRVAKFQFQNDMQVTINAGQNSPYGDASAFRNYSRMNPYYIPYLESGVIKKQLNDYDVNRPAGYNDQWSNTAVNPLYDATQPQKHTTHSFEVRDNFALDWYITEALTLRGQFGVTTGRNRSDDYWSNTMTKYDGYAADQSSYKGQYNLSMSTTDRFDGMITLQYNKLFNDLHMVNASVGGTMYQNKSENYSFSAYGFSTPDEMFFGSGNYFLSNPEATPKPYGNDPISRSIGTTAMLNYTYDDRYYANVDVKIEGSSMFGENNRFAPVWAFGAGWNLHKENFLQKYEWLDNARLKVSYGSTGSQNFTPSMSRVMFRNSGRLYNIWGATSITSPGNPNLKWQTDNTLNIGGDFSFLKNRLRFDFNVYDKQTKDLISTISLPSSSGFKQYFANIGAVQNRGYDATLNTFVLRNYDRKYHWSVGATAGHNANKLLRISEGLKDLNKSFASSMSTSPTTQYVEGKSTNMMWVKESVGIDPTSGKEMFIDNAGVLTDDWAKARLIPVGVTDAKLHGTINTQVKWRNWQLTVYFYYSLGSVAYNSALAQKVEGDSPYGNMDRRALESRWSKSGQRAYFKNATELSVTKATSRFVGKNDYFQLSSGVLAYEVPMEWSKRHLGMQYLKVSGNVGELFYFSKMKRERGIDYPFARQFSLTVNARF